MGKNGNPFCGKKSGIYVSFLKYFIAFQKVLRRGRFRVQDLKNPKRILISNWANMGDVYLSTSVLPEIKKAFPECEIGFLVAPHTQVIIKDHPMIDHIHVIENWFLQWKNESFIKTVLKFFYCILIKHRRVLKEIREKKYDCAIELYPFFPNTENVFWKARIPFRIGFSSSGYSRLLSKAIDLPKTKEYLPHLYTGLLREIGIESELLKPITPKTRSPSTSAKYLVFHMGTTDLTKEWDILKWRALAGYLCDHGYQIFFTGRGEKEKRAINEVIKDLPFFKSYCDILEWHEFVNLIRDSALLVSIDSACVHIAAANDVPFVTLYLNTPNLLMWRPKKQNAYAFVQDREVLFKSEEEGLFSCNNISPREVLKSLEKLLR